MHFRLQNDTEINAFGSCVCKCRFRENHCFCLVKSMFFTFVAAKNRFQIKFDTRSQKRQSTNRISSRFGVDFRGFWTTGVPTNSLEKRSSKNIENWVPKGRPSSAQGQCFFMPELIELAPFWAP